MVVDPITGQPQANPKAQAFIGQNLSPEAASLIRNPGTFYQHVTQGKQGAPTRRLLQMQATDKALGYGQQQGDLASMYGGGGPQLDLQHGQNDALVGQLGQYVSQRLGVGLTPAEEAAIRSPATASVEGQASEANRLNSQRLSAAGVDPRSGLAGSTAGQIERQREQGRAGIEQQVTLADLARKEGIEGLASSTAGLEEGARQFDVGAGLKQQGMTAAALGQLSGLNEQQRQYNTDFSESQKQAAMARDAWRRYGQSLNPSTLEKVSGGISGFLGGLGG